MTAIELKCYYLRGGYQNVRYRELKKMIRAGILIPREDFLFVKAFDHRSNTRSSLNKTFKFVDKRIGHMGCT